MHKVSLCNDTKRHQETGPPGEKSNEQNTWLIGRKSKPSGYVKFPAEYFLGEKRRLKATSDLQ